MEEASKWKENVFWELRGPDGELKASGKAHNLILDDGHEIAAERMGGTGAQNYLTCISLGTSNTPPTVGNTDLIGSELGRVSTTNSNIVGSEDTERFIGVFGPGVATGTIEEAVIADTNAAKGARKCWSRVLTGSTIKGAGDTITVTWEIKNA